MSQPLSARLEQLLQEVRQERDVQHVRALLDSAAKLISDLEDADEEDRLFALEIEDVVRRFVGKHAA
jgi:hypothetical protein